MLQPLELTLISDDLLRIVWNDGQTRVYSVHELRDMCPCASCRERRMAPPPPLTSLTVLSPAEAAPLRVAAIEPVGRYAYSIHFSDGHDTGIYTLETLHELGRRVDQEPSEG